MKIHEIIEDDLTIHYLFQVTPEDMQAFKLMGIEGEKTFNHTPGDDKINNRAAFLSTVLAVYPITTYEDKMRKAGLQKPD